MASAVKEWWRICRRKRTIVRLLFGLTVLTATLGWVQVHLQVLQQNDNANHLFMQSFIGRDSNVSRGGSSRTLSNRNALAGHAGGGAGAAAAANRLKTLTSPASTITSAPLNFIPNDQLRELDYFSDSWLLNRRRFLELPTETIGIIEDAVFVAVGQQKKPFPHSKMLVDWLEFCVEHLSKWWNELDVWSHEGENLNISTMPTVLGKIDDYLNHKVRHPPPAASNGTTTVAAPRNTTLQRTIAVIAFVPYKPKGRKRVRQNLGGIKQQQLNAKTLAATIASLYQTGFGRVVVVGINQEDVQHARAACDILTNRFPPTTNTEHNDGNGNIATIGVTNMEIGHVHVTQSSWYKTDFAKFNVPKAAIVGLQKALLGDFQADMAQQRQWIGKQKCNDSPGYWKYVYLTEPDTLLYTQPHLLPHLRQALDDGISLFPHRLHIIPHESDLPSTIGNATIGDAQYVLNAGEFLPDVGHFANVSILDPFHSQEGNAKDNRNINDASMIFTSCCDGGPQWPGIYGGWKKCAPWWTCGRKKIDYENGEVYNKTAIAENNPRLKPYPMLRLQPGFGAVFASSNHGRRCWPSSSQCPKANYIPGS